jgi:hypothetical protein
VSTLTGIHATPRRSLDTSKEKTTANKGWLSRATYEGLPPRFKQIAKTLQERGDLVIEVEA